MTARQAQEVEWDSKDLDGDDDSDNDLHDEEETADGGIEDEPEVSFTDDRVVLAPANRAVNGRFLASIRSVQMKDVFAQQEDLAALLEANVAGRQRAPGYDKQRRLVTGWWTAFAMGPLGFPADQVWIRPRDITGGMIA
ncbi:hypothetical protein HDU90_004854 [Geranomyces variabilis]|nr:hypothetical protein HDU90_004854 [Geranomyces variabilis]